MRYLPSNKTIGITTFSNEFIVPEPLLVGGVEVVDVLRVVRVPFAVQDFF